MKIFGIWTIIVALSISIVSAYYSIIGLATIFAAAFIPIIIMGTVLEIGKITTAIWFHLNWKNSSILLKTYLTIATIVLMFITSMGIFGFLSKAHVEQKLISNETVAQLEIIDFGINLKENNIERLLLDISNLENSSIIQNTRIRENISEEQLKIDRILERINPAIEEQLRIISSSEQQKQAIISPLQTQYDLILSRINDLRSEKQNIEALSINLENQSRLLNLETDASNISTEIENLNRLLQSNTRDSISQLQSLLELDQIDGIFGRNTRTRFSEFIQLKQNELNSILNEITNLKINIYNENNQINNEKQRLPDIENQIEILNSNLLKIQEDIREILASDDPVSNAATQEIQRLRASLEIEIDKSNKKIRELSDQISLVLDENILLEISIKQTEIETLRIEISELKAGRFSIESSLRKLEAEVGPIKYISDMVYGSSNDSESLERAVRWVILMIIFVFDPLAIILVIAGISVYKTNYPQLSVNNQIASSVKKRYRRKKVLKEEKNINTDEKNLLTNGENQSIISIINEKKPGWLD